MFLKYGAAVLSVTAAQFIAQWLQIHYDFEPLVPFLCAIMFSAWFGGINPGLLAVALSLLAFHYYFLIPIYPSGMEKEIPRLLFGALTSLFIVLLSATQRSTTEALRQSEERFAAFMDNLPGYAWMKDLEGRYVYVNHMVSGLSGYQSLGKTDADIWPADLAAVYRANDQQVIAAKKPLHTVEHYLHEGKQSYMMGSKFPIFDKTGAVALVGGAGVDITERIEAEEALGESEHLLRLVLATLPVGVVVTDRKGDIVLVNAASKRIWGDVIVSGGERREQSKGFWHDSGKRIAPTEWASARAVSQGQTSLNELIDIETFDGHRKTIQNSSAPIRNAEGLIVGAVIVNEDVTERVRAENALHESTDRLQHLSRRLLAVQEDERNELARELHDRVGQNLTVLNINLNIMRTILPSQANDELRTRLDDSEKLVESTTAAIGNVVSELHPPMLDDHGLAPALEWYARQFSARTGVPVAVRGLESAERAAAEVEIALFRIAQEALNNVVKHAKASRVEITLGRSESNYMMSVEDDGVGYDAAGERVAPHTGLGMVTMRERAQAVGGRLEVRSASGDGTRLTVRVPA
jgi:PAS domain S-box-containing protein